MSRYRRCLISELFIYFCDASSLDDSHDLFATMLECALSHNEATRHVTIRDDPDTFVLRGRLAIVHNEAAVTTPLGQDVGEMDDPCTGAQ